MPFVRAKHEQGYTIVDNGYLTDPRLKIQDKGLLTLMLSMKDDWTFNETDLARRAGVTRNTIHACIKRLTAAGYIVIEGRRRGKDGRIISGVWTVYEIPHHAQNSSMVKSQECEKLGIPPDSNYAQNLGKDNATMLKFSALENCTVTITNKQGQGTEGKARAYQIETPLQHASLSLVDIQPESALQVDTGEMWKTSLYRCSFCDTPLLTDGVAFKCEGCSSERYSLDDLKRTTNL